MAPAPMSCAGRSILASVPALALGVRDGQDVGVDYAEAQAVFFTARASTDPPPTTDSWDTPARRLRDAIERIALVELWSRQGSEAMAEIGLDFLGGYVWGRGSALGSARPAVVASAFAVFEPGLVESLMTSARDIANWDQVQQAQLAGALGALQATIGQPPELADVVDAMRRGLDAADLVGRPLFAGLASLPWPDQPSGQLWRAVNLLREFRGDTHVAVCVAAGLDGVEMNVLTERWIGWDPQSYSATRGWSAEALDAAYARLGARGWLSGDNLTDDGLAVREELERRTDAGVQHVIDAIGPDLDTVIAVCRRWSDMLVSAGVVPPDPYKAAAG